MNGECFRMKKVITYGTFDLLHWGHINILRRRLKHKQAYHNYENRKLILEAIRYVDEVIPENNWEQKVEDVQKHNVDVFVMGDDWKGEFDFLKDHCEVVYLERTEGISTSQIKNELGSN